MEGTVAPKGVEKAVVEGMDYFWDKATMSDGRLLVFQNYEHKFDKWPAGEGPKQTAPTDFVKGVFLLPN